MPHIMFMIVADSKCCRGVCFLFFFINNFRNRGKSHVFSGCSSLLLL